MSMILYFQSLAGMLLFLDTCICWLNVASTCPAISHTLQGTNSFHTTTVSSSNFYNSQVSSRAQATGYPATQDYGQQRQQAQQPQAVNQAVYSTSQATSTTTSQPSLRAKMGGPRHYPGYPQSGMQQYYSSAAATTSQQQSQAQPGQGQQWGHGQASTASQNTQPAGNFYNPMDYSAQNPVASQPAPTPGLSGFSSQPSQPTPVAPNAYPTPPAPVPAPAPPTSQGIEVIENRDGWNDPPLLKPKSVRNTPS